MKIDEKIESIKSPFVYHIMKEFQKFIDSYGNYQQEDRNKVFQSLLEQKFVTVKQKPEFHRTVTAISDGEINILHHSNGSYHALTDKGHLLYLSWKGDYEEASEKNTDNKKTPTQDGLSLIQKALLSLVITISLAIVALIIILIISFKGDIQAFFEYTKDQIKIIAVGIIAGFIIIYLVLVWAYLKIFNQFIFHLPKITIFRRKK